MKHNFIHIKLKDENNIDLNNNKILELFKLSIGNNKIILNYNKIRKESSSKNVEINYYNKNTKTNIGKMIYRRAEKNKEIQLLDIDFISDNKARSRIIINNKQYELKKNIESQKEYFKIKIKFLDIIIYLNSMFRDCESLYSVHNFQNINTIYLKGIYDLFDGCSSLIYIDDISNWNIKNINDMSYLFAECSSLKELPDISKWNTININNISYLFYKCTSLKELPDISKWNTSNINDMSYLFYKCTSLKELPDISKWNTSNINNMTYLFAECISLKDLPDISK